MISKISFLLILILCSIPTLSAETLTHKTDNIIVTYPSEDKLIVQDMIETFSANVDEFHRKIGQYPEFQIKIVILNEENEYNKLSSSSSEIIEFSRAFYSRRDETIYLKNPRDQRNFVNLNRILLHEYIHHFVNNFWSDTPLWFNEGMAVYFSGDLNMDREINFVKNYLLGNSLVLEQMKFHYPENRIEWESFYAKSGLAVKYLFKNNYKGFLALWENGARGIPYENSFLRSFFMTTRDYSLLFEDYSKNHFTTEILLASSSMIWAVLPLILIIGWIRKKIIAARIEKSWEMEGSEETEFPDSENEKEIESERI